MGWQLFDGTDGENVSHVFGQSGHTDGASDVLMIRTDSGLVIAVLANVGRVHHQLLNFADTIAKWTFEDKARI
ncbi:unnamed protein product, partial [Medioppia subpectinata]